MASKFGNIAERLVGAVFFFVPDGSEIGTIMAPATSDFETKPADLAGWEDYNIGTINQSAYDPVTEELSPRDGYSYLKKRYVRKTKSVVLADAFAHTLIDYPENLFDELMYGLAAPIVANAPQTPFAKNVREKLGWGKMLRIDEDEVTICDLEFRVKLTIQETPPDSFEPGSPVLRTEHLGDTDPDLETIVFKPTP